MRALVLVISLTAGGCVLASDHVSTELRVVCAEDVPLPFAQETQRRSVAEVEVDEVGATVDSPDARATLDVVTLEAATGIDDFAFAESMALDLLAPGRDPARVAELAPVPAASPFTADGDRDVDLVDYLTAERLTVRVALMGEVPDGSFLVTMSACIEVDGIVVDD